MGYLRTHTHTHTRTYARAHTPGFRVYPIFADFVEIQLQSQTLHFSYVICKVFVDERRLLFKVFNVVCIFYHHKMLLMFMDTRSHRINDIRRREGRDVVAREEMQYRSIIDRRVSSIIIEFEYRIRGRGINPVGNAPFNEL